MPPRMFPLKYNGEIWRYAFVNVEPLLTEEGRQDFVREAIRVYKSKERKDSIEGEGFEGQMIKGKTYKLGGIGGQHYQATIETQRGNGEISVLIQRTIDHALN